MIAQDAGFTGEVSEGDYFGYRCEAQRRVKRPRADDISGNIEISPRGPLERIVGLIMAAREETTGRSATAPAHGHVERLLAVSLYIAQRCAVAKQDQMPLRLSRAADWR